MMEMFIIYLFGFPGAILSLVVSVIGIIKNKYILVLVGAILFLPFCYFLNGNPNLKGAILLPLFHLGSAYALQKKNTILAWSLLLPALLVTGYVLFISLTS